jgi:hypothetical protein
MHLFKKNRTTGSFAASVFFGFRLFTSHVCRGCLAGVWSMTLPRGTELQWQREVIERWLNTPSIPFDARTGLLEMLKEVKEEMGRLEAATRHFDERTNRQASWLSGTGAYT